jgi:hypothetical protein
LLGGFSLLRSANRAIGGRMSASCVRPIPIRLTYSMRASSVLDRPGQKRERLTLMADEVLVAPASFRWHLAGPQRQLRRVQPYE